MSWRPEHTGTSAGGGLNSPMSSRPVADPGKGGMQAGDKDGMKETVALGAPPSSTKGGPVGMQITEDTQNIAGKGGGAFPSGTLIRG